MLQQPISKQINHARSILLVGGGGGYDLFSAIPLFVELNLQGRHVQLASMLPRAGIPGTERLQGAPGVFRIGPAAANPNLPCPEAWLARWMEDRLGKRARIWGVMPSGVQTLRTSWRFIISQCEADCVVLFDGGLDSILRGDEVSIGHPYEDLASLSALAGIEGGRRIIAGIGLGAGLGAGVHHADVLQRIAELTQAGAFLGSTSLVGTNTAGTVYREAVQFAFDHQTGTPRNLVHDSILRALGGEFGAEFTKSWVSPLLPIYWYFDMLLVARSNLLISAIESTETFDEIPAAIARVRTTIPLRHSGTLPP